MRVVRDREGREERVLLFVDPLPVMNISKCIRYSFTKHEELA